MFISGVSAFEVDGFDEKSELTSSECSDNV